MEVPLINKRPRVVIVGRPNVGKSTLFNRLYGRRRAITDPTPGVTRDVIEENCSLAGIPVTLVDTGGIKADPDAVFDSLVAKRSLAALEHADVILLLLELGELTAEDQILVDALRGRAEKTVLAVNKSDTQEKDYTASEFYALGLGEVIPISAAHGRNMDLLAEAVKTRLDEVCQNSGETLHNSEDDSPLVLTLAGKPNVGKSTLANWLIGEEASLVSPTAGTTRDTVVGITRHKDRPIRIVDTAGMRRKAKVAENVEYYAVNRAIRAMYDADVTVLLLDAEDGLSEQDKKISAQAVKKGQTIVMALNKWDEEVPNPGRLKKAVDRIRFQFPVLEWAPLVPISALKGYGVSHLLDIVFKADRQQNRRINTSELNRAVGEWVDLTPPPTKNGRAFKVRYVTQVSTKPVRFAAFVNRKANFPDAYRRFLINQLRREFGFNLIPIDMEIKEGKR